MKIRSSWMTAVASTAFAIASASAANPAAPQRPDGQRTPVDAAIPAYDPVPPLTGELYIGGGFHATLLEQWAAIFQRAHPNVRVHLAAHGSTSAFGQLVEGVTPVVLLTREFMPFELDFMQAKLGMDQLSIPVATGGYSSETKACVPSQVILVHQDNPIKGLSLKQLDAIFSKTRKRGGPDITRWGQLGLTGEWADKPINVYHPEMPDGVPNGFLVDVLQGGEFRDTNKSLYHNPSATKNDRYAIALGNRGPGSPVSRALRPAEERDPNARLVPLSYSDSGPFAAGSFDDVRTRAYPLIRTIHLVLRRIPNKPVDPLAKEFVRVALSQEGQYEVARTCFMPLPSGMINDASATLEKNTPQK